MSRNNIIIVLCMFLCTLTSIYSTYPEVSIIATPSSLENTSLFLEGWLGTSAQVQINNQVAESSFAFSNPNSISIPLEATMDQVPIEVSVGERFNFVHSAQTEVTYDIFIYKESDSGNEQIFRHTLSSGISPDVQITEPGTYVIQDLSSGLSRQFSVNYQTLSKTIPLTPSLLSDGQNTITIISNSPNGESSTTQNTFEFEKYANSITFTSPNVSQTTSITGTITAENLDDEFYYIINQEGFLANCGSYAANKITFSANGDEVTLSGLQEGNNIVRIISTSASCDTISGEYRFEVLVDRVAPRLNLVEATYGRPGSDDSGEYEPEVFEQELIYTNENTITLFYDAQDIATFEYIINGRADLPLVNYQTLDQIPNIQNYYVESDGSNLEIVLQPFSEYTQSYVLWSYDRIEERRASISNGEIRISLNLEENVKEVTLQYFEGDGPDTFKEDLTIYDIAFQDEGEKETVDEIDSRGLYEVPLSLDDGRNNITLLAYDISGNVAKESFSIDIDSEEPELGDRDDFDPFPSSTVHFPIQKLKGNVNKPGVHIEVFTIPEGEQTFNDFEGVSRDATCSNFEQHYLVRAIDDLNRQRPRSTTLNMQEIQLDISIQSLLLNKETTTSDENGNFEVYIGLEEASFTRGDVTTQNDRVVDRTESTNKVCIIMEDQHGNVNVEELSYTLDTGNTMWKISEVTTTPNSIYAAEIEQVGTTLSGSGDVQFSMIARFQYLGPGEVEDISAFTISLENTGDSDPFQGRGRILSSGMNYVFDKTTNEMIVYVPIEVSPLGEDPLDYPSDIRFNFGAKVTYTLEDNTMPIDTRNPIYFEAIVNIERPLDHTKWLTPSTIESGLEFINKTIKFTEKATNVMKYASLGSTLLCTGYKFYHSGVCLPAAQAETDPIKKQEAIDKCNEKFYNVCDRVAGLESPPSCEILGNNNDGFVDLKTAGATGTLNENDFTGSLNFNQDGRLAGNIEDIRIIENSNRCEGLNAPRGQKYVEITGNVNKFEEQTSVTGGIRTIESEARITGQCVLAKVNDDKKITSINLQQAGNLCYTPKAPVHDNTKCSLSLYGIKNQPGSINNGIPGKDPSTSILSSLQCGAVVDTYKHLEVALRVQQGIQKCLEQARIGEINGGYCERLVSAAVCDLATNVVLPEVIQSSQNSINKDGSRDGEVLSTTFANLRQSERAYNQRYEGTALAQAGLSTDQILNTACLGALTGDWSVFEENILSTIEDAEVDPVFGPPIAESRLQGYNPITGEIAIRYQFTHAAVSGGQRIRTEVQFICNPNAPNAQFCPENTIVRSGDNGPDFRQRTLFVAEDESVQENIIITENEGVYWYNQIQLVHEYEVKGERKEETQVFNIAHKSEMFAQCDWDGNLFALGTTQGSTIGGEEVLPVGGISCDTIFGEDSLLASYEINDRETRLLPVGQTTYYPGNSIYLDLSLSARGNSEGEQLELVHYISCKTDSEGGTYKLGSNKISPPLRTPISGLTGDTASAQIPVELIDTLEDVGSNNGNYVVRVDNLAESQKYIALVGTSGIESAQTFINSIEVGGEEVKDLIYKSLVVQNLNVNNNNANAKTTFIPLNGLVSGKTLNIEFNGKPENVQVQVGNLLNAGSQTCNLDTGAGCQFEGTGYNFQSSGMLVAGACTLKARVLPASQASQITLDNFETFSPISASGESEDIITDQRLDQNDIYTTTIQVKERDTNVNSIAHFSSILIPSEDGVITLNKEDSIFTGKILYQNSLGKDLKVDLEYDFSINGYGSLGTNKTTISEGKDSFKVLLDSGKIEDALNSLSIENNPTGLFRGSKPSLEGVFTYTINYYEDNNNVIDNSKKETGAIRFNIISGEIQDEPEEDNRGNDENTDVEDSD